MTVIKNTKGDVDYEQFYSRRIWVWWVVGWLPAFYFAQKYRKFLYTILEFPQIVIKN